MGKRSRQNNKHLATSLNKSSRIVPHPEPSESQQLSELKHELKSMRSQLRTALAGGYSGSQISNHREEALHYENYSYVDITAICMQLHSATVSAYIDGPEVEKQVSARKSLRAAWGSRWKALYGQEEAASKPLTTDHNLMKLLQNPNPHEPGGMFRFRQGLQIRLTGGCFIWNVPNVFGRPCERYVIPTTAMTPVYPTTQLPYGGYLIQPNCMRWIPLMDDGYIQGIPALMRVMGMVVDAREIQKVGYPHPIWLDDFQSPMSACSQWIDAERAINKARTAGVSRGMSPGAFVELPGEFMDIDQDELDIAQRMYDRKYGGPDNVGKTIVVPPGTEITPNGNKPSEMGYHEGFADTREAVQSLHNTPPVVTGQQPPGSYASYYASMRMWMNAMIEPLCGMLAESDTFHLAPKFGDGITIEMEPKPVNDEDELNSRLQVDCTAKIIKVNEARALRGMPPLPGPDGEKMAGPDPAKKPGEEDGTANPFGSKKPGSKPQNADDAESKPLVEPPKLPATFTPERDDSPKSDSIAKSLMAAMEGAREADEEFIQVEVERHVFKALSQFKSANPTIDINRVQSVGKWLKDTEAGMPGYGLIFVNQESGRVWYVGGDSDARGFSRTVEQKLMAIPGITKVTYESEAYPPEDDGWVQAFPMPQRQTKSLSQDIEKAASGVAIPTDAQKESGNYKKGHVTIQGLRVTIENPKGSTRSGTDRAGKKWSTTMANHYGYVKGTTSDADGDHIDVFIGPNPESELVFVIDQLNQEGQFDEHKCMIGFSSKSEAEKAYLSNYSAGWTGIGSIHPILMDDFKEWLKNGDSSRAIALKSLGMSTGIGGDGGFAVNGKRTNGHINRLPILDRPDATLKHDVAGENRDHGRFSTGRGLRQEVSRLNDSHQSAVRTFFNREKDHWKRKLQSCYTADQHPSVDKAILKALAATLRSHDFNLSEISAKDIAREMDHQLKSVAHAKSEAVASKATGDRWITIHPGGESDGDGVHIKISGDGDILAGPQELASRGIHHISDFGQKSHPDESVEEMKPHAHAYLLEHHKEREAAKQNARHVTGLTAGRIAKHENGYRDHSTIPGFDTSSRTVARENPELGLDPEAHDTPAKVWELIREGAKRKPSINSPEVHQLASEWANPSHRTTPTHEPSFEHDADWDLGHRVDSNHPSVDEKTHKEADHASKNAEKASKEAADLGTPGSHEWARNLHQGAKNLHSKIPGNEEQAKHHSDSAASHMASSVLNHMPSSDQHPSEMSPDEYSKSGAVAYRTAQGSLYSHHDGKTIRVKTVHEGHDKGDHGIKNQSVATHYVSPESAKEIGMWQSLQSKGKRIIHQGDQLLLTSDNPKTGKRGVDGRIKIESSTPKIGLAPVELFDKSSQGEGWYRGNHPGNAITEMVNPHEAHDKIVDAAKQKKSSSTTKSQTEQLSPEVAKASEGDIASVASIE